MLNRILIFREYLVQSRFLRLGFFLTLFQLLGGLLGYFYQILMGRMLLPSEFAVFSSIMALFMFFSAPMAAISMLIVSKVSALKAHNNLFYIKSLFFRVVVKLLTILVVGIVFFLIATPQLQIYLKVEDFLPIGLFASILFFSIFNTVFVAFFQGLQRFFLLGIFGLGGIFIKILISVGLIVVGYGVEGALLGVLCSMILVFILGVPILFKSLPQQMPYRELHINFVLVKRVIPVLVATTAFAAMTQLDMALVNWYFSPDEAGLYAAASVLGKAVLYLPGGLILVLFPMVSENYSRGSPSFSLFRQAVIVTLLACGAIACIYWFYGDLIIKILYGTNYQGAGKILQWYGLAILPLTVVVIAEQYLIAKGRVLFAWLFLLILPIQLFVIHVWHSELWMILLSMGGFGFLLAVIGCILMWRESLSNLAR